MRSSPIRAPNAPSPLARAISASASALLPEPDGPRIRTPLSPWITAVAWIILQRSCGERGQFDDKACARAVPYRFVGIVVLLPRGRERRWKAPAGRPPRSGPGRHGPQRSGVKSRARGPSSARSLDLADPYKSARICVRAHAAGSRDLVIIDRDDNAIEALLSLRLGSGRRPLERNPDDASRFGKGAGIIDKIGDHLSETGIVPKDKIVRACVSPPSDRDRQFDPGGGAENPEPWPRLPAEERRRLRGRLVSSELRVKAGGVGDVADQPIEPPHVVLHDGDQPIRVSGQRSPAAAFRARCAATSADF